MELRKRMFIDMENILETLQNLTISEGCFQDIMEMIDKEVVSKAAENSFPERKAKVNNLMKVIRKARSGAERTKAIKDLGVAQKRANDAESKIVKQEPKKAGITFTNKFFN